MQVLKFLFPEIVGSSLSCRIETVFSEDRKNDIEDQSFVVVSNREPAFIYERHSISELYDLCWDLQIPIQKIAIFCVKADIPYVEVRVILGVTDVLLASFSTEDLIKYMNAQSSANGIRVYSMVDMYLLFAEFGRSLQAGGKYTSLSLVDNNSNTGLLTLNNEGLCRVPDNAWLSQDMSKFWDPPRLGRFIQDIMRNDLLAEYEWTAYTMCGNYLPLRVIADVERVVLGSKNGGRACRLVKVLQHELV